MVRNARCGSPGSSSGRRLVAAQDRGCGLAHQALHDQRQLVQLLGREAAYGDRKTKREYAAAWCDLRWVYYTKSGNTVSLSVVCCPNIHHPGPVWGRRRASRRMSAHSVHCRPWDETDLKDFIEAMKHDWFVRGHTGSWNKQVSVEFVSTTLAMPASVLHQACVRSPLIHRIA